MKPLPVEIRERLAKLIVMLSSEPEAAMAAAAIGRLLTENGLDWHDLAGAITAAPRERISAPDHTMTAPDLNDIISRLRERDTEGLEPFLTETLQRAERYFYVKFTERNWKKLQAAMKHASIK